MSDVEGSNNDAFDSLGCEAELLDGLLEPLMTAGQALAKLSLDLEDLGTRAATGPVDSVVVYAATTAEHGVAYLIGEHGADRAEVVSDLLDLVGHKRQKSELCSEPGGVLLPALGHEVADLHDVVVLAVAVDAAVALFKPRRVPGDLPVQHPPAVSLEIDAFRRGVSGHQDAYG